MTTAIVCGSVILLILYLLAQLNFARKLRWRNSVFLWANLIGDLICVVCVQWFAAAYLPRWLNQIPAGWAGSLSPVWAEVAASNLLSGLVLIVVKLMALLISSFFPAKQPPRWAGRWYRQDGSGNWQPAPAASAARKWTLLMLCMSLLGLIAGGVLSHFLPDDFPAGAFRWWPILWIAAVMEMRWFVSGREATAQPAEEPPAPDEADYEKTFREWFVCRKDISEGMQAASNSGQDRVFSCVGQIAARDHVLVETVLFSDLGEALISYLDLLIAKNENVLVLAQDSLEADKSADFIRRVLEREPGRQKMPNIRSPRNIRENGNCDLAVLTPQQVLDLRLGVNNDFFSKELRHLVVLDTAQILSWQSDLLATVVRLLVSYCQLRKTVFMSSSIPLQLVSVIQGILDVPDEEVKVIGTELNKRRHSVYLWRKENIVNNALPLEKLTSISVQAHDFDLTAPLAVKAYRLGHVPIRIMSERFPVRQISQAIRMAADVFSELAPVDRLINELQYEEDQSVTVILEDEECLLGTALSQARRFAADQGNVHLISRPYMLRDYFMTRFQEEPSNFIRERTYANPLSASFTDCAYTAAVWVMIEATARHGANKGITEKKLRQLVKPFVPADASLRDLLCWCGRQLFRNPDYNVPQDDFKITEGDLFTANDRFEHETWISVEKSTVLKDLQHSRLKRARLSIPGVEYPVSLRFSADSIRQRILIHQGLIYDGTIYQVTHIDDAAGLIKAELATEDMRDAVDFVQTRIFDLSSSVLKPDGTIIDQVGRMVVQSYLAEQVRITIPGYYMIQQDARAPKLLRPGAMIYQRLGEPQLRTLKNTHLTLLGLYWPEGSAAAGSVFLSVLMNELFRTYFPSDWPCIAACPLMVMSPETDRGVRELWEKLFQYYPSLSPDRLPNLAVRPDYAYIVMIEDCDHADGRLLKTLLGSVQRPFEMPLTVLADYLKWLEKRQDVDNYLSFGGEEIPPCFELENMRKMLSSLYGVS